ncbi:hypothetical protein BJ508DRAFT_332159 [Ascobolus immersus RN42]|uniref:Uncharacterized protein n=1 Tax=Ascobolus immersus RN42 TaxID=1160509 RepID=A0A3N4HNE6_ASCIM|nr:hypothetical protein BJ508DRAFT_332159 [Ascobolus immersus RN42]
MNPAISDRAVRLIELISTIPKLRSSSDIDDVFTNYDGWKQRLAFLLQDEGGRCDHHSDAAILRSREASEVLFRHIELYDKLVTAFDLLVAEGEPAFPDTPASLILENPFSFVAMDGFMKGVYLFESFQRINEDWNLSVSEIHKEIVDGRSASYQAIREKLVQAIGNRAVSIAQGVTLEEHMRLRDEERAL